MYCDDGARTSIVSLAWLDHDTQKITSVAFPFNQGTEGKPEDDGQRGLWDEDVNLPEEEWLALLSWLEDKRLVMHNAPFDVEKVRVGVGVPKGWTGRELLANVVWDTQIACKELDPLEPTGLKATSENLWGEDERDHEKAVKAYLRKAKLPAGRYDLVPWDVIGPYAAKDAEQTFRLYLHQRERFEMGEGRLEWLWREFEVMRTYYKMTKRGLPFDASGSLDAADVLEQRKKALESRLPFRATDVAAKQYFFGPTAERTAKGVSCLGLIPVATTETGRPQLTAEVLAQLVEEKIPHAQIWADWSKLDTAVSMWYRGYAEKIGPDGRLRTYFRQTKVTSGRASVERINLQAIPQDYRLGDFQVMGGVPTPRALIGQAIAQIDGWECWELDLAQAELRVAARRAKCKRMLELIHEGADLHGDGVREMFHIEPDHERWFPFRQAMKRGNFSLIFGVGWRKLQADIKKNTGLALTNADAEQFVQQWNSLYPEYQRAIYKHSNVAARESKITLVNGRARWFSPIEDWHKAFNQYVQASLAEFGKDWMLFTEGLCERAGIQERADKDGIGGAGLLLTIHDSQVLLLPKDTGPDLVAEITDWAGVHGTKLFDVPMGADSKKWSTKE